ncbi:unnamed protein product [Closterium sp. NIES-54]
MAATTATLGPIAGAKCGVAHRTVPARTSTQRSWLAPLDRTSPSAPILRRTCSRSRFSRGGPQTPRPQRAGLNVSAAFAGTSADSAGAPLLEQPDQRAVVADVARLLSKPRSYDFREHHHHEQHSNEALSKEGAERAAAASVKEGTTIGEVAAIELVRQLSPQGREVLLTALFPGGTRTAFESTLLEKCPTNNARALESRAEEGVEACGCAQRNADSAEAEEEFEHADAHHDGVISEGEFEQYVGEQQAKIDALHRPLDFPQLALLAKKEVLGNLGFGLTKNTVMIISGDFIASTLGAAFGFSTLMAAGLGNAVADVIGTWCRGAIESSSSKLLPGATFSSHQLEHPKAQLFATVGAVLGVTVGGLMGLSPLFFLPARGGGGEGGHGAGPAVTAGVAAASAAASAMKVAAPLATIASADGVEEAASGHATASATGITGANGATGGGMRGAFTRGATAHASISAAHWMGPSPSFRPPLTGAVGERGGLGVALLLALSALNVARRVRGVFMRREGERKVEGERK